MRGKYFHIIYYMSTTVSDFRSETADVDALADRETYPLDTQEQKNEYNAKIISLMRHINAKKVPRFEDPASETGKMPIGDMPEAYTEKAKTLMKRLLGLYQQIRGADGKIIGENILESILFGFDSKYKAKLNIDWETVYGPKTEERAYGTYRRWGGKKRTHKRKTHVNKSRKNKKKRGNK